LILDSDAEFLETRDLLSPEDLDVTLEERLESFLASVILRGCSFKPCLLAAVALFRITRVVLTLSVDLDRETDNLFPEL
jgi:hypothetical protein